MSEYNHRTKDQYLEGGGGFCPECETEDVVYVRHMTPPEDGVATRLGRCLQCNAQWRQRFILDDISLEREGDHHNQQGLFQNTA